MNSDDFERGLRDRMKARAAELDRTANPPPPLAALLATGHPTPRSSRRTTFRLGLTVASVAVVALVVVTGSLLLQRRPEAGPLPTTSGSAYPSLATPSPSLATTSLPPTPIPTWSPIAPSSTGGLTVLEPSWMVGGEVLWAPDGQHFAVISSGDKNVHMFDKAGTWVGEAPAWEAAWGGDDTLIVLPDDPTSTDDFLTAYIAHIGYNDLSTMQALPGRYEFLHGNGNGTVALQTAQGYAVWLNGSLKPEIDCGCVPLVVSPDGSLVASMASTGLKVAKTASGQDVRSWPDVVVGAHPTAGFSPDGKHLAVSSVDGSLNTLVVLTVSDGRRTDLLPGHFAYNGTWVDNGRLFAGDDSGGWWFLRADGASPKRAGLPSGSWAAVTSSTGSIAAVDDYGTTLLITTSGKTSTVGLPSHAAGLYWSPDGTELVVTCNPDVLGRDAQVVLLRP
jgi:WD40 repeat protein